MGETQDFAILHYHCAYKGVYSAVLFTNALPRLLDCHPSELVVIRGIHATDVLHALQLRNGRDSTLCPLDLRTPNQLVKFNLYELVKSFRKSIKHLRNVYAHPL